MRIGFTPATKGSAVVVYWSAMDAKNALDFLNGYKHKNRYLVGTSYIDP